MKIMFCFAGIVCRADLVHTLLTFSFKSVVVLRVKLLDLKSTIQRVWNYSPVRHEYISSAGMAAAAEAARIPFKKPICTNYKFKGNLVSCKWIVCRWRRKCALLQGEHSPGVLVAYRIFFRFLVSASVYVESTTFVASKQNEKREKANTRQNQLYCV